MNKEINIVYIDDKHDEILSKHMENWSSSEEKYHGIKIKKNYNEVNFTINTEYKDLLKDTIVRSANVILIDNHLFEERTGYNRFSGQYFKVIMRKILPYIEVIIITQDKSLSDKNIIQKFSGDDSINAEQYYTDNLDPYLNKAIKEVIELEKIASNMKESNVIEKVLQDSILNSMSGDTSYDNLQKKDIDELIAAFKELKNGIEYR